MGVVPHLFHSFHLLGRAEIGKGRGLENGLGGMGSEVDAKEDPEEKLDGPEDVVKVKNPAHYVLGCFEGTKDC